MRKKQMKLKLIRTVSVFAAAVAMTVATAVAAPRASVVVVYPLTATESADPGVGAQIAGLIGQELTAAGGIEVRTPAPSTGRADYLETARTLGADYYVTGFVTKISGQLSVVEQLVSTLNNTTVWSNSGHLVTTDDARAQGDLVRTAVLGHTGRGFIALNPAPGLPSPKATSAATAISAATATSTATKPTYAVLLTGGTASEKNRAYADAAMVKALRAHGYIADVIYDPVGDLTILGPAICASTGAKVLLGGQIAVQIQPDREINQWATATLDVASYDCGASRTRAVRSGTGATYNWNWAVDQAVAEALKGA
jgi:hypothetical protein